MPGEFDPAPLGPVVPDVSATLAPPGTPVARREEPRAIVSGPAPGLEYALTSKRVWAWVLDNLIMIGVVYGVGWLLSAIGLHAAAIPRGQSAFLQLLLPAFSARFFASLVIMVAIRGVYTVGCWLTLRATPGQLAMGLEVRDATTGSKLTPGQAVLRWALLTGPFISGIEPITYLFMLYQLFLYQSTKRDPYLRGWHDHRANTVVVRVLEKGR